MDAPSPCSVTSHIGVAGRRVVHGRRPDGEVVEVVLVDVQRGLGHVGGQVGVADGNDLNVIGAAGACDGEHV